MQARASDTEANEEYPIETSINTPIKTSPIDTTLAIVIVSYNSKETIAQAVEPLLELYQQGSCMVVIIDNHGNDGVYELLIESYPWVKVLKQNNVGFGTGCNIGFDQFNSQYALFLNPDAQLSANGINYLVDFLENHKQVAAVAPAIVYEDRLQFCGGMPEPHFYKSKSSAHDIRNIVPNAKPLQTNWLCGAILMVKSDLFAKVGKFDPRFFLYFEETDLCKRFLDSGYELWACGQACGNHVGGKSSHDTDNLMFDGCIAEHFFKSRYYFFKKHYGLYHAVLYEMFSTLQLFVRYLKGLFGRDPAAAHRFKIRLKFLFFC